MRSSAERCSSSKVLNTICSNCKSGDGQGDIQLQSPAVNKKLREKKKGRRQDTFWSLSFSKLHKSDNNFEQQHNTTWLLWMMCVAKKRRNGYILWMRLCMWPSKDRLCDILNCDARMISIFVSQVTECIILVDFIQYRYDFLL